MFNRYHIDTTPETAGGGTEIWDNRPRGRFGQRFDRYHIDSSADNVCSDGREMERTLPPTMPGGETPTSIAHWDVAPPKEYFDELARVSKNQVIWGGNYFDLPPTRCFLIWRKLSISENFSMSMCEYAWTSFNDNAKLFECAPQGTASEPRIHPTQKPVKLYSWILGRYAQPGFKILDTHVGSASSIIACHRAGLQYVGFELDPIYYKLATERIKRETAQIGFFDLQ